MFASLTDSHNALNGSALQWVFEAIEAAAMTTQRLIDTQQAVAVWSPANSAWHFGWMKQERPRAGCSKVHLLLSPREGSIPAQAAVVAADEISFRWRRD